MRNIFNTEITFSILSNRQLSSIYYVEHLQYLMHEVNYPLNLIRNRTFGYTTYNLENVADTIKLSQTDCIYQNNWPNLMIDF